MTRLVAFWQARPYPKKKAGNSIHVAQSVHSDDGFAMRIRGGKKKKGGQGREEGHKGV